MKGNKMKKTVKTYSVVLVLTIIGIVLSVASVAGGTYAVFNNWESHEEIPISFKANETSQTTAYYACNSDSLSICQEKGNSSCKYSIYYKSRNQKSYDKIDTGVKFSENEVATAPYSLAAHWWNDVCFKVNKTAGTNVASTLLFSLGQSTD